MKLQPSTTISEYFGELEDPRIERSKLHKLIDIITITICAVISGADSWVDIELYGKTKYEWLKKFLELTNGIPAHDTFARVFARLDTQQLQQCFLGWVKSISQQFPREIVAIDGKTLRHSYDSSHDKPAIAMVSAWASANRLILAQVKVDVKSNEITAIPQLLRALYLKGCIVTLDAMGCQREVVSQIVDQSADYVITLKKNQGSLYERVEAAFKQALKKDWRGGCHTDYKVKEQGHGREETRYYRSLTGLVEPLDPSGKWSNLNSVGMAKYFNVKKDGTVHLERRYYLSSLSLDAKELAKVIRKHWTIENQLHWVLDVQFNEDSSRIRKDNAPANLAVIRHIALNLLNQEKTVKTGVKSKRKKAGWDNDYLLKVLKG